MTRFVEQDWGGRLFGSWLGTPSKGAYVLGGDGERVAATVARAMVRSPRIVGVDSPRSLGRSTHTYAARTEPAA